MDFEKIILARKAITDKHGEKKPQLTFQSVINCPVCTTGELHYQISAHNGHIAANCSTSNCVNWME